MKISNPFKLLQKLDRKPPFVSGESVNKHLSKEDRDLLQKIGITASQLFEKMHVDTEVLYDRTRFYNEVNRALDHWMIGPAMELYADYATNYNQIHGASVWITSENPTYQRILSKLLDDVGIEERIFDWGWTIGSYGDLFVKLDGQPGLGITSIDDHDHPINTSRIDVNGALIGFYKTPQGTTQGGNSQELIPPWEYVHFRLLGAKKKRTVYGDPNYCLRWDTRINLLNGTTPAIKEMAENPDKYVGLYLWSVNPRTMKLEVDRIVDVKKTRLNAKLVRVWLDNEQYVDCTPDHRFMLRDGSYQEAGNLTAGQSLMPLYTRISKRNKSYKMVYGDLSKKVDVSCESDDAFQFEHQLVQECMTGSPLSDGYGIHHSDLNRLNNDPSNLQTLSRSEHSAVHNRIKWSDEGMRKKMVNGIKVARKTSKNYKRDAYKQHKNGCNCMICKSIRGENNHPQDCDCQFCVGGVGKHKSDCSCFVCVSRREKEFTLLNHRVIRVEQLPEVEDTYDLQTEKNHNFSTSAGVFVHNSEFQTSYLMTGSSNRQVSSKYGTSLLINAIAPYKRLRLAEDSLLMARLTRGIIRYVWKLKVDSGNAESVNELITQVVGMLKKARALNTSATDPNFDSKFGPLSSVEDILIPVWGDVGDLDYSKIGEDADIRWIADVDNLRDQLACALRVPLSVLGGYVQEASGQLGSQAIEKLSVEFAHSARRLQRALKAGIKRICQVHLAYMDMDPDPRLFEVNMSETSTAEEESLRESMDAGVDVIDKMVELAVKADPTVDKVGLVNYFNQKLLKLEDFDLKDFHQSDIADEFDVNGELLPMEEPTPGARMPETPEVGIPEEEVEVPESVYHPIRGSDLMSFLPGGGTRASSVLNERFEANWKSTYEGTKISTEDLSEKSEEPKSGEPLNG